MMIYKKDLFPNCVLLLLEKVMIYKFITNNTDLLKTPHARSMKPIMSPSNATMRPTRTPPERRKSR